MAIASTTSPGGRVVTRLISETRQHSRARDDTFTNYLGDHSHVLADVAYPTTPDPASGAPHRYARCGESRARFLDAMLAEVED